MLCSLQQREISVCTILLNLVYYLIEDSQLIWSFICTSQGSSCRAFAVYPGSGQMHTARRRDSEFTQLGSGYQPRGYGNRGVGNLLGLNNQVRWRQLALTFTWKLKITP